MPKPLHLRAEEARARLPMLLTEAEKGRTTVISRHGRSVAALVPIEASASTRQKSLLPLAGSGRGLWGADSKKTIRKIRDEWPR